MQPRRLLIAFLAMISMTASDRASQAPASGAPGAPEPGWPSGFGECFPKGGLGIVDRDVYIDLRSPTNALILADGDRWTGRSRGSGQVVLLWNGAPVTQEELPRDFQIEKSVLISFERGRVAFVDFPARGSGYYKRPAAP